MRPAHSVSGSPATTNTSGARTMEALETAIARITATGVPGPSSCSAADVYDSHRCTETLEEGMSLFSHAKLVPPVGVCTISREIKKCHRLSHTTVWRMTALHLLTYHSQFTAALNHGSASDVVFCLCAAQGRAQQPAQPLASSPLAVARAALLRPRPPGSQPRGWRPPQLPGLPLESSAPCLRGVPPILGVPSQG